jgi:diaminohydroxyphosphoribosylaminopyrimidine deaminase/5-amino-6-(5-phosphoribosylamino)uracil reductase
MGSFVGVFEEMSSKVEAAAREKGARDRWDRLFMRIALGQAAKGLGHTSPNPAVGAVLARGPEILSVGHHRKAGGRHAERAVLESLEGMNLSGATLYVTLEPCCHYGATPPCTELILDRGVGRVVASIADPNPVVSGKGFKMLADAGVRVESGLMEEEAKRLNEAYLTKVNHGRPFVAVKLAVTIDGRIADREGSSKWITGRKARRYVHFLRSRYDAVMVGSGTALADDPRLNVRSVRGRDPVRMILDPELASVRRGARLTESDGGRTVYVCSPGRPESKAKLAASLGADVWEIPESDGRLDLAAFLGRAVKEGLCSVLVEGGAETVTSLVGAGLVDKLYLITAPKLMGGGLSWLGDTGLGGLADAPALRETKVKRIGDDVLYCGYFDWKR